MLPHLILSLTFLIMTDKSQTKFWTLTLFEEVEQKYKDWQTLVDHGKANYICYQMEVSPSTGKKHLQGYVVCPKKIRLGGLKKLLGSRSVHAVRSDGTPSQNRTYCSKSETAVADSFLEFGDLPDDPARGKRNDFEEFKEAVKEGLRDKRKAREAFPELIAKYPRWCYDYMSDQQDLQHEDHGEMYPWQKYLDGILEEDPDDRKVIFVYDRDGNNGKTWFCKQYVKKHDDAQLLTPSKKADMAYALREDIRVLFMNLPRTDDPKDNNYVYSFIESVKDGIVFSPKYESRMKYLNKVHVVVMMNQEPNEDLLSKDRYVIIDLMQF